ncbi:MAG: FadR/GntR family transcriptional regulator [Actinomycetota bacterium]
MLPVELGNTSLLLKRIRSGNTFEETVERILQTIRLGLAHPGDRLPGERELAAMLAVSRDTIREATSSLAEAGFLVIRRGRYGGTFVAETLPEDKKSSAQSTFSEIDDVLIFREVVECGAAYAAAGAELSKEVRNALWVAHEETSAAKPREYRRLDSRLHLLIAEVTGSGKLVTEVAYSRMRVNELLDQIPLLPPNIAHSNQQHEAIISAILRGNSSEAEIAMRDHLAGSAALLRGFLG